MANDEGQWAAMSVQMALNAPTVNPIFTQIHDSICDKAKVFDETVCPIYPYAEPDATDPIICWLSDILACATAEAVYARAMTTRVPK